MNFQGEDLLQKIAGNVLGLSGHDDDCIWRCIYGPAARNTRRWSFKFQEREVENYYQCTIQYNVKSAQRRRKHCTLVVVRRSRKKIAPRRRGAGRAKFNQLETVTTFTYRLSLVKINTRNFELSR